MFSKTFELSLTRGYVSRWGMAQAVRELIQNALDSNSPFVYEFSLEDGDTSCLLLTSEFTTLLPQTLLLGATSKADAPDAIGSFGEGYKIALLVLTRLGYDVEMRNGDVLWKPRFRHSRQFGEELLVIDETALPDKHNKGLTFAVKGLSAADTDEICASCLQMQASHGDKKTSQYGEILMERKGKLYVGGLFVCDTEMVYGYNIKPEFIKLERDRQTVSSFDLKSVTRDMWFEAGTADEIARMIEADMVDVAYAEYSSPTLIKEACYRLFIERNPGAVVANTQAELKQLVAQGMKEVIVVRDNFYAQVKHSPSYLTRPSVRVETPKERMEAWYAKARYKMHEDARRSFKELLTEAETWRVA
jgi:hypothetical protein